MGNLLSTLFGGNDGADTAERILTSAAPGVDSVQRAASPTPVPLSGDAAARLLSHPFIRGLDDQGQGKSLVRPYERSAWVQRAIKHVSEPIAGAPLRFATMTDDGLQAFVSPLLAAFWEWPALGPEGPLHRSAVVEATVGWLKLAGEAFWLLSDNWLLPRGARDPFVLARPDSMKPVLTQDGGKLLGWLFRDAAGRDHQLLPEQVIHPKLWNPYDPVRGLGEYASARLAAEGDVFAAEFARNLMAGNGDRGPIIASKGPLSDAQMAQIEAGLRAKKAAAQAGTLKTTFLPADVTISDPQIAQVDAEFVAARVENRKEVYMAFGVPSSFAEQMHRATTAHESDRYILIEDTCKPMGARVAAAITGLALRMLGQGTREPGHLVAYFDFEQHSVMMAARTERIDAATKLATLGMPFAQINAFLNLQAPSFPGDDVGHLPLAIQTVKEANTPAAAPAPAKPPAAQDDPPEDGGSDPTTLMLRALATPVSSPLEAALAAPVVRYNPHHGSDGKFASADEASSHGHGLTPTDERAWNGEVMETQTKLSKLETGAIGEKVIAAYLKSQGHADARTTNVGVNNFPVDLQYGSTAVEVKTGLVSNSASAQHWRATIGQPGKKESEWLKTASKEDKKAWNQRKMDAILERKEEALKVLSKQEGKTFTGKTLTTIINPDTKTADVYQFDGFHLRIPWNSAQAKAGYAGSYKYE